MVPGDPNNPIPPVLFDPQQWADTQSPVPSQEQHTEIPYRPDELIQRLGLPGAVDPTAPGSDQPQGNCPPFVGYRMDSRPPNSYDFIAPDVGNPNIPVHNADGSFTVPNGYVCIVRGFCYNNSGYYNGTVDVRGMYMTATPMFVSILQNNLPVKGLANIDITVLMTYRMFFPCFFIAKAGDVIQGQIKTGLGFLGDVGFMFFGTMILDDGRDTPLQTANGQPEPVMQCTGSAPTGPAPSVPPNATQSVSDPPIKTLLVDGYYGPFPPEIPVNLYMDRLLKHQIQVQHIRDANPLPTIVKVKRYPGDTEGI